MVAPWMPHPHRAKSVACFSRRVPGLNKLENILPLRPLAAVFLKGEARGQHLHAKSSRRPGPNAWGGNCGFLSAARTLQRWDSCPRQRDVSSGGCAGSELFLLVAVSGFPGDLTRRPTWTTFRVVTKHLFLRATSWGDAERGREPGGQSLGVLLVSFGLWLAGEELRQLLVA